MTRHATDGIGVGERGGDARQGVVLRVLKVDVFASFELDANGIIVAARTPAPARFAGMPCAFHTGHELRNRAIAPHEEVRRDAELRYARVIPMRRRVEPVQKERFDAAPTELAGWQADRVNDEKLDRGIWRAIVAVGGSDKPHTPYDAVVIDDEPPDVAVRPFRQARP